MKDEIDEVLKKYKVTLVSQTFRLCDAFNTDKTDSLDGTDYKLTKMIYIPVDDLRSLKKKWEIDILKRVASVHCGIPTKTLKRADLKDWLVYEINQLTNGDK